MDGYAGYPGDGVWRRELVHDAGGGEVVWGCCGEDESERESETRYTEPVEGGVVYWAGAEVEMAEVVEVNGTEYSDGGRGDRMYADAAGVVLNLTDAFLL